MVDHVYHGISYECSNRLNMNETIFHIIIIWICEDDVSLLFVCIWTVFHILYQYVKIFLCAMASHIFFFVYVCIKTWYVHVFSSRDWLFAWCRARPPLLGNVHFFVDLFLYNIMTRRTWHLTFYMRLFTMRDTKVN